MISLFILLAQKLSKRKTDTRCTCISSSDLDQIVEDAVTRAVNSANKK